MEAVPVVNDPAVLITPGAGAGAGAGGAGAGVGAAAGAGVADGADGVADGAAGAAGVAGAGVAGAAGVGACAQFARLSLGAGGRHHFLRRQSHRVTTFERKKGSEEQRWAGQMRHSERRRLEKRNENVHFMAAQQM